MLLQISEAVWYLENWAAVSIFTYPRNKFCLMHRQIQAGDENFH